MTWKRKRAGADGATQTDGKALSVVASREPASTGENDRRLAWVGGLFFLFLLVLVVRPKTGAADDEMTRLAFQDVVSSGGDAFRQLIYTISFLISILLWIWMKGARLPRGFSIAHIALLCWIIASATWAYDPAVSIRRSVLLFFVMTFILIPIDIIGSERTERVLYLLLASCLIASIVSVPLFGFAKHPPTETDPGIIGDWRGIFAHKNVAGGVVGIGIIVFVFRLLDKFSFIDAGLAVLGVVFMVGSHSKTPAGFLPVAILFGLIHRYLWRDGGRKLVYAYAVACMFALGMVALAFEWDRVEHVLGNYDSFTGRAGIWAAVMGFVADHPWLGAGYSSLFGTGVRPPIADYANSPYQEFMAHSHDGYIDLLGTIGIPGLVLAVISAIILPIYQIMTDNDQNYIKKNAVLLAIIVFCALENLLETQLYSRDKEIWTFFFISIIILQIRYRERHDRVRFRYRRRLDTSVSSDTRVAGVTS